MSKKRSVHFSTKTYDTVEKYAEMKGYNFNQAVNVLLEKYGQCELWRLEEIQRLEQVIAVLKRNTLVKTYEKWGGNVHRKEA